ncbi:phage holin family protein [Enterococcus lemanii]|jgi:toxin secretion/phage lysis holin|uniref:Phage holin family protein n=1 Tax=Enterococcus lemanii TaxID=1159752 RepID=A0ABV9MZB2_9ENTE|nr:phage holin family protein [Enterococcus lemanii]MBM7709640.1 toxin secretion/phage lysis holin [Enterococcus lemanii]
MQLREWLELIRMQKVLYILSLLSIAMVIDFISGTYAAKLRKKITSKIGINGIIRKIASLILLVFFIPVAYIIPGQTGVALLTVLYVGYLGLEIQSILENYRKIGIDTALFQKIFDWLKEEMMKK